MRLSNHEEQLKNCLLMMELFQKLNAYDTGNVRRFCEVTTAWRCPCCHRSKSEIARLDKNGNLLCAIAEHHDHFNDMASDQIRKAMRAAGEIETEDYMALNYVEGSFQRFSPTLVCEDCNVAEPEGKRLVCAKSSFTFAPWEIMQFVEVVPNHPHTVNYERCKAVYEAAITTVTVMASHLRGVIAGINSRNGTGFVSIGDAAVRALNAARVAKMKAEDQS